MDKHDFLIGQEVFLRFIKDCCPCEWEDTWVIRAEVVKITPKYIHVKPLNPDEGRRERRFEIAITSGKRTSRSSSSASPRPM